MGRGTRIILPGTLVGGALLVLGSWWLRSPRERAAPRGPAARPARLDDSAVFELARPEDPLRSAGERSAESRASTTCVRVVRYDDDSEEHPLAGAEVRVHGVDVEPGITDAEGRCRFPIGPRATLDLEVTAEGFVGHRSEERWKEEIDTDLSPCIRYSGRVLDATTRQPVAGARVHVQRVTRWVPLTGEALTDPAGQFRIDCAYLSARLCASAPGYPEVAFERKAQPHEYREPPASIENLEILLEPGPTLAVQVLDLDDDAPIAGARVGSACTDGDGRAWVDGPEDPRWPFGLDTEARGYCGISWSAFPDRLPSTLVLRLPRPAYFEGVVRDAAGDAVAGATVAFDGDFEKSASLPRLSRGCSYACSSPKPVVTDSSGAYRIGPLVPGSGGFEVTAKHPDLGVVRVPSLPAGTPGSVARLDLTLVRLPTGIVEGRVLYNGSSIPGSLFCTDAWNRAKADTDFDGNYRFERVAAGSVELELRSRWLDPVRALLPELRARLRVPDGGTVRHDFVFDVPFADVGGHVTHADGEPASGKKLHVVQREAGYGNDDTSGTDGRWTERVPDVGWEYEVELEHGSERLRVTGVRAGDGSVDFVLPAIARLPVRVVDAESGVLIRDASYTWKRADGTLEKNRVQEAVEPATFVLEPYPGVIDLFVEPDDGGYPAVRRDAIEVRPGDNSPLELRVQRGLELALELAPGLEEPRFGREWIFLLDAAAWGDVRAVGGPSVGVVQLSAGGESAAFDPGPYTERQLETRLVQFEAGIARVQGLAAGRYRFKAFPAGIAVDPAEVSMPHEGRLVFSWARGN